MVLYARDAGPTPKGVFDLLGFVVTSTRYEGLSKPVVDLSRMLGWHGPSFVGTRWTSVSSFVGL